MKSKKMTRDMMIDILVQDKIHDWVCCENTDGLEDMLCEGCAGFFNWSTKELEEATREILANNEAMKSHRLTPEGYKEMLRIRKEVSICKICDDECEC